MRMTAATGRNATTPLSGSALLVIDAPDAGRWYIDVYNAGSDPGTYTLTAR